MAPFHRIYLPGGKELQRAGLLMTNPEWQRWEIYVPPGPEGTREYVQDLPLADAIGPAYHVMQLLEPLRALTLVLSEKGRLACEVLPYISQAYERLQSIEVPDHWRPIKAELIDELKKVTVSSPEGSMLIAAYYMTLQGKFVFQPHSLENSEGIEPDRPFLPDLQQHPERPRLQTDQLARRIHVDDESDSESDETPPPDIVCQSSGDELSWAGTITKLIPRHSIMQRIELGVGEWAARMRLELNIRLQALNQLWAFLNSPVTEIPCYGLWLTGDEAVWNANSTGGPHMHIAQIAERVVIIPASEISCERAISLQGYIQTKRNARSKPDLLTAKLAHLCE